MLFFHIQLFKEFASHNLGTGEKNSLDNLKYKDIFKVSVNYCW